MKVIEVKDLGVKYTNLTRGSYLVDGELIEVTEYAQKVPFKDTISIVTKNNIVKEYTNGTETISNEEYIDREFNLSKNKTVYGEWNSLENEFEYRKFKELWKPVYIEVQTISEPIVVSKVIEVVTDTGNPYITSFFSVGAESNLYTYYRPSALIATVHSVMQKLGMEYKEEVSYGETKNQKIYGNSTHSVIKYVTAFGNYIFGDSWNVSSRNGKLEDLQSLYEKDVEDITNIINTKYNVHFGKYDKTDINLEELISKLSSVTTNVSTLNVNKKSYDSQSRIVRQLNEIKTELERAHKID